MTKPVSLVVDVLSNLSAGGMVFEKRVLLTMFRTTTRKIQKERRRFEQRVLYILKVLMQRNFTPFFMMEL
jgi:hypothetical protein